MILIADSGGSKTDWRVIHRGGRISQYRGVGFNPYYMTSEEMALQMRNDFLVGLSNEIEEVYFYGAGCSSPERQEEVKEAISSLFPTAKIQVDHDLSAAAKATCGHLPGIACILGTGSNSCDYDGEKIVSTRPAPGYILGDEGGGGYVGKKFLQDFIYDEMPEKIRKMAIERFHITQHIIQDHVYRQPFPSRYMASFCRFITENKSDPYCYGLFYNAFQDFFDRHVSKYENYTSKPVNFVGSIAYYNSDILRKAALDRGIHVNIILESPIAGLTLYHQELL
ncbi:N-acetylglucosamine kinase-like BadF-type ATPase [Algoriphagus boseongensis]|uniref:N-acetylglucosamine kinase-like BadF-type ATPase n=1 Tax=Algoriphagus boseongensis TaxID=1442587 RepID=A0A4R6T142_9BACT|nr:N-acetylglucosamine kinase [Algoriphagus boseongensis]TDQ13762.1 N-acetylglucosamine kinase-like BadF-type ATPase [Algoriphagus boseongensis]